jgi:HAMP domain-containing protein
MLPKIIKTGLLLAVVTLFFTTLSFAATRTIRVAQDVVLPGGQTLQAGTYDVVVNEKLDQVQFLKNSKVVVTHTCKCIPQEKKNKETQLLMDQGSGNTQVLQQILLRGETRIITLPS